MKDMNNSAERILNEYDWAPAMERIARRRAAAKSSGARDLLEWLDRECYIVAAWWHDEADADYGRAVRMEAAHAEEAGERYARDTPDWGY